VDWASGRLASGSRAEFGRGWRAHSLEHLGDQGALASWNVARHRDARFGLMNLDADLALLQEAARSVGDGRRQRLR
jgi:hypothetical protein